MGGLIGLVIGANASLTGESLNVVVSALAGIPNATYEQCVTALPPVIGQVVGAIWASLTAIIAVASVVTAGVGYAFPGVVRVTASPLAVLLVLVVAWAAMGYGKEIADRWILGEGSA
jgi:hypothetical protein